MFSWINIFDMVYVPPIFFGFIILIIAFYIYSFDKGFKEEGPAVNNSKRLLPIFLSLFLFLLVGVISFLYWFCVAICWVERANILNIIVLLLLFGLMKFKYKFSILRVSVFLAVYSILNLAATSLILDNYYACGA
jgi:hypothetical protein